jgi:hypothetical protein
LSGRARRFASSTLRASLSQPIAEGDRFLQIGAALLGFDQRRPQPGEKAYLVVDRPGVTDQGILLADFGATEHAANGALEKGNGVVGQPRDRVEYRRDQSRAAARRREGPQMLCGETRALARKLAQPFGMNAFGGSRIEADRAQSSPLLDQARKGAMTGSAGRLTRPGQPADRCSPLLPSREHPARSPAPGASRGSTDARPGARPTP